MATNLYDPEVTRLAAQRHLKRWDRMYQDLSLWMTTWQELAAFIMPRKANVNLQRSPGQTQTERLLDSTAVHANELLAASMQGSLTSGSVKWFYYRIRGLAFGKDVETDKWLETDGDTSYDELKQSNFSAESHEYYADLGCIGTAAMFMARKMPQPGRPWTGFRFKTLKPGSYCIDENDDGIVDTLYYKFLLTARQAAQKWKKAALPARIVAALDREADQDKSFEFLHCVYPRSDRYSRAAGKDGVLAPTDRPFASTWVACEDQTILEEGGYYEFPFAVARWTKASGEKYGRSPGFTALADIKTLNKLVELKLRALANLVYPPLKVRDDGVLGTVRLSPGGLTHVRDMEAVQPLLIKGDINTAVLNEEKLQQAVRRMFFSDQLQLQEGPQMTAYEVQVRYELMQRILGPTLGRLEVEYLGPVIEFVYYNLERAKRLPPMPPTTAALLAKSSKRFDIEYEGPLQRAQRLGDVVTIQRFFQIALPLVEADPELMDNIDTDATIRIVAKQTGTSSQIIRSEKDRDERRAARRQQQADMAKQNQTNETIKAAGAGAPALKALVEAQKAGILPQGGLSGQGVPTGGVGR